MPRPIAVSARTRAYVGVENSTVVLNACIISTWRMLGVVLPLLVGSNVA